MDESEVDILHIISPQTEGATCDQYRYPKAGYYLQILLLAVNHPYTVSMSDVLSCVLTDCFCFFNVLHFFCKVSVQHVLDISANKALRTFSTYMIV